jgi:hypothetical protein
MAPTCDRVRVANNLNVEVGDLMVARREGRRDRGGKSPELADRQILRLGPDFAL